MALTPEQLYRLGAESLGWNNTTASGKALIAEDMKLLKRLQLANAMATDGSPLPAIHPHGRAAHGLDPQCGSSPSAAAS